jgi:UDP-perosamine 4-acetyltransferase
VIGRVVAPLVNPNEPEAQVVELHVVSFAPVSRGQHLCTLETSKATAEVDCEFDGYAGHVAIAVGSRITAGEVICEVFAERPDPSAAPVAEPAGGRRATRKAEELAARLGVDLATLPGTGFVTEAEVRAAAPAAPIEVPPLHETSVVLFGGGGLARTIIDLVAASGDFEIAGIVDDALEPGTLVGGVPVLGPGGALPQLAEAGLTYAANAVGAIGRMATRRDVSARIGDAGLRGPVLVEPTASVAASATLADGALVFAQAVVSAAASVGPHAIINSAAIVSHDCVVGADAHIAPGAILAGEVVVGDGALVGMAVTAPVGVSIGAGAVVGNGATLLADVPAGAVVSAGSVWS